MLLLEICHSCITFGEKMMEVSCTVLQVLLSLAAVCYVHSVMFTIYVSTETMLKLCVE